jgi:DNA-binding NarL/FixJ family response regulator
MSTKICVSILEDHQSIIDGYTLRLSKKTEIEIVATVMFGEELEPTLEEHPTDVLIVDINVPTSQNIPNPYPILHLIPKLLQIYPELNILVISMHNKPTIIKTVMETGASGYILKDDQETLRDLANVVITVANGGIHLSQQAYKQLFEKIPRESTLTTRQLEILSLCVAYPDATTEELADHLGVANSTIRNLLSGTYMRLNVRTRAAAILKALKLGLIAPITSSTE